MATFFGGTGTTAFSIAGNFAYFFAATCTATGNVTDGRVYYDVGGGNIVLGVYSDSAGSPGSLLGTSVAIALSGGSGLKTTTFSSPFAVTNGTPYWLAWLCDTGTSLGKSAGASKILSATYPTLPGSAAGTSAGPASTGGLEVGVTAAAGATFVPLIVMI